MIRKDRLAALGCVIVVALLSTGAAGCSRSGNKAYQGLAPDNPSHITYNQFKALSPQQKQQYLDDLRKHQHSGAKS